MLVRPCYPSPAQAAHTSSYTRGYPPPGSQTELAFSWSSPLSQFPSLSRTPPASCDPDCAALLKPLTRKISRLAETLPCHDYWGPWRAGWPFKGR